MEAEVDRLARKTLDDLAAKGPGYRYLVGISGVPGSGKTTLGASVAARINEFESSQDVDSNVIAHAIPMDGFHHSRAHLAAMPNAQEAIHRRGAAFTFDAEGFVDLVKRLRGHPNETVFAPSFDHALKDPVADSIAIPPTARIVFIEGNYIALNRAPWTEAAAIMDRLWYVNTPADVAVARLAKRHLASGIVADEKEAWERASGTDGMNADDIRANLLPVDEKIEG
ncbi:hypothetical protein Sste5346_008842 [Sporothrix stenoceras]|uniref:Phosphoribulokinase/uridine kinase domain-containing protein n=1 Tax=Sporothrix stenoceras TaxID=5173 RepID=A0ABR3YN20_9PEZI